MEPSSLILVAIIGVWAAYLVPNWLRKRDDLAQSRVHDRFSSGLRVLHRRSRRAKSGHRSGDAVLASPRVIVDADGELLFIAGDRAKAAELRRAGSKVEPVAVEKPPVTVDDDKPAVLVVEKAEEAPVARVETPAQKIAVAAAKVERVARVQVSARVGSPTPTEAAAPKPKSEPKTAPAAKTKAEPKPSAAPVTKPKSEPKAAAAPATKIKSEFKSIARPTVTSQPSQPDAAASGTPSRPAKPVTVSTDPLAKAPAGFKIAASARSAATQRSAERTVPHAATLQRDMEAAAAGRAAATRRARIMMALIVATVSSWGVASVLYLWIGLPATILLLLHALASRAAALRSREHLIVRNAQLHAADQAHARPQPERKPVPIHRPAAKRAAAAKPTPEPAVRRPAAGDNTWLPIPVPPPTYTLKPAAPRPEPAPLELPAAQKPAVPHKPAKPAAAASTAVSRAALPRTAADIERILALDPDQDGYEHRTA